jgi:FkbM family methyltransferase
MRTGKFEPDETRIFVKLLDVTDAFVDIGANVGYYCCLALQQDKSVVAIEPQLQNLDCLYQNLTSNGWQDRAEVFPVALSSAPGLLSLYGASGPSASLLPHWAGYSSRFKQTVPTNTLDNLLAGRFAGGRLIIKIDVEGAEFQVLEGAFATIARQPKPIWLIEVCFREYHPSGVNPDLAKIFQLFWDNGYASYGADEKCSPVLPEDIKRWLATGVRDLQTFNYVFIDGAADLSKLVNGLS